MLTDPGRYWPGRWNPRRLVVQHMDARELRYEDATFDPIFSSSSLEHFGDLGDVALSLDEAVRVLRPGGTLSLSTELRLAGDGLGLPGVILFGGEDLIDLVVGDRPWELVGAPAPAPSPATLSTAHPFADAAADVNRNVAEYGAIHFDRLRWSHSARGAHRRGLRLDERPPRAAAALTKAGARGRLDPTHDAASVIRGLSTTRQMLPSFSRRMDDWPSPSTTTITSASFPRTAPARSDASRGRNEARTPARQSPPPTPASRASWPGPRTRHTAPASCSAYPSRKPWATTRAACRLSSRYPHPDQARVTRAATASAGRRPVLKRHDSGGRGRSAAGRRPMILGYSR